MLNLPSNSNKGIIQKMEYIDSIIAKSFGKSKKRELHDVKITQILIIIYGE